MDPEDRSSMIKAAHCTGDCNDVFKLEINDWYDIFSKVYSLTKKSEYIEEGFYLTIYDDR